MWTVFLLLLIFRLSRCTVDESYETETVNVGDDVTLLCPLNNSEGPIQLFWFRLVSGALPEFLGRSSGPNNNLKTSCCTAKENANSFVLVISGSQLSHTGLYFCVGQTRPKVTFLKGVFLTVKEPGPDIPTVIQDISSDPDRPQDSKTLQCSVLYDPDSKPCPEKHRVSWFRAGSDESRPSFIYTHGNRSDGCEKSSEAPSLQKCTYSFSESVSSSDEETDYCAVAACGEILIGNGTKLKAEGNNTQTPDLALILLSTALAICLIVIALLIYTIKTKSSCKTDDDSYRNAPTARDDQQSQQREESSLIYAAQAFSKKKKINKDERRNVKKQEEESIYSGVRTVVTN